MSASRRVSRDRVALLVAGIAMTVAGCASQRTPIAYRPITLNAHCAQREEDGFREDARLVVEADDVRALDWTLWVGERGRCTFALEDFRQTRRKPHVELTARDGGRCKLMVWQEPGRVTLAHADCESHCTRSRGDDRGDDIYAQAWPVSFDPSSGRCATIQ